MTKATWTTRQRFALLMIIFIALNCSPKGRNDPASHSDPLSISNGLGQNGLSTNGLWQNGLWQNGLWQNGLWQNGLWQNGLWQNGLAGDTLRNSPYARQLLQYIYSCAMPLTTYDTILDPNQATPLSCTSNANCDVGYECSPQGTCVVPLHGAVGVGINADQTSWGASGRCDETCQRWVSACVLARTNAYGVHVQISMRAPADAPQAIKDALAVGGVERNGDATHPAFSLREGAYYGNIFATTPTTAPPSGGSGAPTGPIASTPVYYACAGPGSNIPEITKRFCSSQGDQSVINVPGVCLPTVTQAPVCEGEDTNPKSATFGAIQDCHTASGLNGPSYQEVITVYLQTPIAVCGNGVCEDNGTPTSPETMASCPSDCHPGSWAIAFDPNFETIQTQIPPLGDSFPNFTEYNMTAVGPDNSVVVVGDSQNAFALGNFALSPGTNGSGILIKYKPDGSYAWSPQPYVEFNVGSAPPQLGGTTGVTVARTGATQGDITVIGLQNFSLWTNTFGSDGAPIGSGYWPLNTSSSLLQLASNRAIAVDSQGNIIFSGSFSGRVTFPTSPPTSLETDETVDPNGIFLCKVTPQGSMMWVSGITGQQNPGSLALDANDNIVLTTWQSGQFSRPTLLRLCADGSTGDASGKCPDGSLSWTKGFGGLGAFTTAIADGAGNVYAGGVFASGMDFGGGPTPAIPHGAPPFLAKFDKNGNFLWANRPDIVCPPGVSTCGGEVWAANIAFDTAGNPVLASWGDPAVGGGIDFGSGIFPTYSANNLFVAAYHANNGQPLWSKHVPGILGIDVRGMTLDSQGRVIVGGAFAGSMEVDGRFLVTPVPEEGSTVTPFVASFDGPSLSDTTPPVIGGGTDQQGAQISTVPHDILAQATSPAGALIFYMPPTAIDAAHAGTSVYCAPPPNTTFPIGKTTVTCTASDPVGNSSTASFTVTVVDTLGPIFAPVRDVTVAATGPNGAIVGYAAPSAVDQVDGTRTVTCTPASGNLFSIGTTKVICRSSDNSGNQGSTTFSVIVTPPAPPVSVTCLGTSVSPVIVSTAPGVCGAPVSTGLVGSCAAGISGLASCTLDGVARETLGPGDHPVALVATGLDGSTARCTSYVRVTDGEKPVVTCSNQTVACTGNGGATVTPAATCADNCSCTASCATALFPVGASSGSCTAKDSAGNSASCQPTVTVVDAVAPVVTPRTGLTQLQCNLDKWSDPGATALDQCVGDVSGTVRLSGAVDPSRVGTYIETYSASDPSGNRGSATRSVKVIDTVPPTTTATEGPNGTPNRLVTIAVSSSTVTPSGGGTPITGSATCWSTAGVAVSFKATDACALKQLTYSLAGAQTGGATVSGGSAGFAVTRSGTTTVSYYAIDGAGNVEVTNRLPVFVSSLLGFGISCAPSPSLRGLPAHGTVSVKGSVTVTDSRTGKQVSQSFSFTFSY